MAGYCDGFMDCLVRYEQCFLSCILSLKLVPSLQFVQNLKVHDNRRQLFSSTASKESTNPFVRQRPLAARPAASASAAPPPPWANGSPSSSLSFPR